MDADLAAIRSQIQAELAQAIPHLGAIVRDPKNRPLARVKAFEALADRGGLPPFKAQITQTVSQADLSTLREQRRRLEDRKAQVAAELESVRGQLLSPQGVLPVVAEDCDAVQVESPSPVCLRDPSTLGEGVGGEDAVDQETP